MTKEQTILQRWKEGMKNLTPVQMLRARMVGNMGSTIGLSMAFITLLYRSITDFNWLTLSFAVFVFFMTYMQVLQYIGTKQQYVNLSAMFQQTEETKGAE